MGYMGEQPGLNPWPRCSPSPTTTASCTRSNSRRVSREGANDETVAWTVHDEQLLVDDDGTITQRDIANPRQHRRRDRAARGGQRADVADGADRPPAQRRHAAQVEGVDRGYLPVELRRAGAGHPADGLRPAG